MKEEKFLKIASVFSGIGSFEYALKKLNLNHKIIFACDNDKFVKKTYFSNYNIKENRWYNDIEDIDGKKYYKKIDILVGGSPCQSFSSVGLKGGLSDLRGQLIFSFVNLINDSKPKMFIFENVKGLLTHNKGRTWEVVKKAFDDTGYDIKIGTMNSKDYGIPQSRSRVFIIGFRKKNSFEFPHPVKLDLIMNDFLEDSKSKKYINNILIHNKVYESISGKKIKIVRFNLIRKKIDKKYYLSPKIEKYVCSYGTKKYLIKPVFNLDIAKTILQSCHKMHRAGIDNYVRYKNGKIRKLTPRECHRLMGFDDDFEIVVSDLQAYRQAGNSIVVENFILILLNVDIKKVFKIDN